jgi:hypothetical protein
MSPVLALDRVIAVAAKAIAKAERGKLMTKWIEMGPHDPRPDETLTAIEQEGFGIVCAVLDCEGESVYRILNAVNTHDELLAECRTLLSSLQWEEKRSGTTYHGYEDLIEAVAKAEGRDR